MFIKRNYYLPDQKESFSDLSCVCEFMNIYIVVF